MPDLSLFEPYALAALRVFTALMILQHGLSKTVRWPINLAGEAPRPSFKAMRNGVIQVTGGSLVLIGLGARPAAFILSGMTAFGYFSRYAPRSFYPMRSRGGEMGFYAIVFLYLVFAGPGAFSLDALFFRGTWLYPG